VNRILEKLNDKTLWKRPDNLDRLRDDVGTSPAINVERKDDLFVGCKGITADLVDYPHNPYRAIYEMVTSTWGSRDTWGQKWNLNSPEDKMAVVIAVLQGDTLPSPLEAPSFTFKINGLSRSSFDQLARHRYSGIVSLGTRDNSHLDAALRIPKELAEDKGRLRQIQVWWTTTKTLYQDITGGGFDYSWESGRFVLPMGMTWRFSWTMNYRSLKEVMAQRLGFHEQADTVAVAWLMREAVKERFPLLAAFLRPACDWAHRCIYHKTYSLSELFGCLFGECGRWPVEYHYSTWPQPCCTQRDLEADLGFNIPLPKDWDKEVEEAMEKDARYFSEGVDW